MIQTILAFDYGTRRIGVAVGETLTASARPLLTVQNQQEPDWDAIASLVTEWQPTVFVLGLPCHADGSDNAITKQVRAFAEQLQNRYQLPLHFIDETLTSHHAEQRQAEWGTQRPRTARQAKRASAQLDAVAAQIILETWLAEQS